MAEEAKTARPSALTLPSDIEIRIERAFDAPRDKVWRVWNDPELQPHWMGPAQYEMTTSEMDLRPGGGYRWVWDLGEGQELVITGRILEVDEPTRIVAAEKMEGFPAETFNLLLFTEEDGRTTVAVHLTYANKQARDAALESGMQDGMDEGYARLDMLLAGEA